MAFIDEGTPRWDTFEAGGTGDTAVDSSTEANLLVVGSKGTTDKYEKVALTSAAIDDFCGVTDKVDGFNSDDPYKLTSLKLVRVKTSKKLRVRTDTAYVAADYNKSIVADATSGKQGYGVVSSTNGKGRVVGGETIGTKHYLDFWLDEGDNV